jgi:hypothetical protein
VLALPSLSQKIGTRSPSHMTGDGFSLSGEALLPQIERIPSTFIMKQAPFKTM